MKKVLVIGATGSLASVVIEELKKLEDVGLTLFARNIKRIPNVGSANIIQGDAMYLDNVKNAVQGQDIVYVNLAGNLDPMSKNIVKAMEETGVKRIIAISSIGIYEKSLRSVLVPYRALADNIENSNLDYTILRPDWFTNANELDYALTLKGQPETGSAISRKSIASFVAKIVENPKLHVNENLGISKPE